MRAVQFVEDLTHAVVRSRMSDQAFVVKLEEAIESVRCVGIQARSGECAAYQNGGPVTNHFCNLIDRQKIRSERDQQRINGVRQIPF